MIITSINYSKYGGYEYLLNEFTEPLFLKPDGVRTRYPIGWNGYGRYMPGSLKVSYNGIPCNITEEDNGIFYNFSVAPADNTDYNDYEIDYVVRPLDYAFSTGLPEGGYEGEEYFLFPNWNNALGEGDAFWIGKYQASNNGSNIPQSKSGVNLWANITRDSAINVCINKGIGFGLMRNRQWVSIALWYDHHNINVIGNVAGNISNSLDEEGTTTTDVNGYYNSGRYIVTDKTIPTKWNHNGLSTGIHHMVGNLWEIIDGLESRNCKIYIYDKGRNYVDSGVDITDSIVDFQGKKIIDIINTSNEILNEGIPSVVSTNGYIPNNLANSYMWNSELSAAPGIRGNSNENAGMSGIWSFSVEDDLSYKASVTTFRLCRRLD